MGNFTFEEIKQLHEMGFSPDQIMSFTNSAETIPADQPGDAHSADEPSNTPDGAADAPGISETITGNPVVDKPVETVDNSGLISAIEDLKKTLQASNIRTQSVETVAPANELENIMAEFIRPSYEKKGDG